MAAISAFLRAHERILIIVFSVLVGLYFSGRVLTAWELYSQRSDNLAHAALQANVATANQIADSNAKQAADYKVLTLQLADSNRALSASQYKRDTSTQTQQTVDRTLPPNELATRWATLLKIAPESIQVEPGGKDGPDALVITPAGARETVVQLENIPTLQADLRDERAIAANKDTQITSLVGINGGLNKQVDALNVVNTSEVQACTADKNLLKAQARKSKLRWFGVGFVTGFVARQVLKTYTGF